MQAVILAAGLGTRMKNLTRDTPKPLLRVGEMTLIEHKLNNLPPPIEEVIVVIGYLGEKIRAALGDEYSGRRIIYVEQRELTGTGPALFICRPLLKDKFLVLMGDDLYRDEDLAELVKYPLALLAWELKTDLGDARWAELILGKDGSLRDILEKRPAHPGMLVNAGAYCLDKRIFDYPLQPAGSGSSELGLPQTIAFMARAGERVAVVKASWWKNITAPSDLRV